MSYLVDKSQQINVNGFLSDPLPVPLSVLQGGHLFPLLFTIFIMNTSICFKFYNRQLFVDDIKLNANVLSSDDCCRI